MALPVEFDEAFCGDDGKGVGAEGIDEQILITCEVAACAAVVTAGITKAQW